MQFIQRLFTNPSTWSVLVMASQLAGCTAERPDEMAALEEAKSNLGAANDHTVLMLGSTVSGTPSREEVFAVAAGFTVEVVDDIGWAAKTTADFASYRAIVLGDRWCADLSAAAAAVDNREVWGPAIDGNVIIIGTDPVFHQSQGGDALTHGGVAFAAAEPGTTGAYVSLSCYYALAPAFTPVALLEPFESPDTGRFFVRQVGCYNDAHIVANHPALAVTTDESLSNWSCSVHEVLHTFPSDFLPLAIANGVTGLGDTEFADGTHGIPYILARGKTLVPVACGDSILAETEQCDDGNTNNGDGCSAQCTIEPPCGNGTVNSGEECDDGNTSDGDGCSANCLVEHQPPVANCMNITAAADSICAAPASIDDGSFDPDGDAVVCVQDPPGPYGLGDTTVTLTCTDTMGESASCTAVVTVQDVESPQVATSSVMLWSPSHDMYDFTLDECVTHMVDQCADTLDMSVALAITRIESDEPPNWRGDGNTCIDIVIVDATHAQLRAERAASGNGRVYTIFFTATDGANNQTEAQCTVAVPRVSSLDALPLDAPANDGCAYCVGSGCGTCPSSTSSCN